MSDPRSPEAPVRRPEDERFWRNVDEGRFVIERCAGCGGAWLPPRPLCPTCHRAEWVAVEAAGTGTVNSYVIVEDPDLGRRVVVLVDLDESVRIVSNLREADEVDVRPGLPVEAFVDTFDNGVKLVQFRPSRR